MDPEGVEIILQQCTSWVGESNRGILMSTHRLDEVERICDRVILMNQGCSKGNKKEKALQGNPN